MMRRLASLALAGTTFAGSTDLGAQSVAQRVESAADGTVILSFAARAGVCGNGRSFISVGGNTWFGSSSGMNSERDQCATGPVRVELTRSGRMITDIDAFVGPVPTDGIGGTNLGTVSAPQAAEYLLSLAARLDGAPSREAILPAMLADSTNPWNQLLAIARDQNRPRETRRSAISWIGRLVADPTRVPGGTVVPALTTLAASRDDNLAVREQAVNTLARLEDGQGIPALIEMTRSPDLWLVNEVAAALSRSGDPRAREFLRTVIRQPGAHEEVLAAAIRGLGGNYATGGDAALLRDAYARLTTTSARERIIASLASMGGRDNAQWLLALAANDDEPVAMRRRALQGASKAEAPIDQFVAAYERVRDRELKQELIDIYSRRPEKAGTDKLLAIARSEEDPKIRRHAIQRLSRSNDPRVAEALKAIVNQ